MLGRGVLNNLSDRYPNTARFQSMAGQGDGRLPSHNSLCAGGGVC